MMDWTVENVKEYCREVLAELDVSLDVPVIFNGRLQATLGRVKYVSSKPIRIEFSRLLFTTVLEDDIYQIIKHECCHYAAAVLTGRRHGHDDYFKKLCGEVGCTLDGHEADLTRTVSAKEIYRYRIECENCGYKAFYHRRGYTIQHIEEYRCGNCGGGPLKVYKNW